MNSLHFVVVPGVDDSDDTHWQTHWQEAWGSTASRIAPSSWTAPERNDWTAAVERAVGAVRPADVVIVAHSLGCLAVTEWLTSGRGAVAGVFLVAPPDSAGPNFPSVIRGFTPTSEAPLGVPGMVVASTDDPYCNEIAGRRLAAAWGVEYVTAGTLGHINSASNLGAWQDGRDLLTAFTEGLLAA